MQRPAALFTAALVASFAWQSIYTPYAVATNENNDVTGERPNQCSDAHIYRITPEQYKQIEPFLLERGLNPLTPAPFTATNEIDSASTPDAAQTLLPDGSLTGTPPLTTEQPEDIPMPISPGGDGTYLPHIDQHRSSALTDDIGNLIVEITRTDWTSSDAAIIIFVVIGLTVVLAVIIYAGAYLYDVATGSDDYLHWWNLEIQTAFLTGNNSSGYSAGLKLSSGFERNDTRIGAILETGYLDVGIRQEGKPERLNADGVFAMAGAGVRWTFGEMPNPSHFGLELLAGTAWDDQVDVMSVARANLSLGIGSRARLGVTVGSMFLGLDPKEGILKNRNNFTTLLGIETGIRF